MSENRTHFLARIGAQPGDQRALKYDPAFCDLVRALGQEGKFQEEWSSTDRRHARNHAPLAAPLPRTSAMPSSSPINCSLPTGPTNLPSTATTKGPSRASIRWSCAAYPAIFGKDLVDLQAWLMAPVTDAAEGTGAGSGAITADQVKAMSDDEIRERIEILRRRRQAEARGWCRNNLARYPRQSPRGSAEPTHPFGPRNYTNKRATKPRRSRKASASL